MSPSPNLARRDPLPEYVGATKGSASYNAHTYPTKVPPAAIVPFIEASTLPGGLVADPFSGSGMTGVAALLCGRNAVLSDLSPGAVHLSRNHTRHVNADRMHEVVATMGRVWMDRLEREMYTSSLIDPDVTGIARHTIWSESYLCPACGVPVVLWDVIDAEFALPKVIRCDGCGFRFDRTTVRSSSSTPVDVVVKPDGGGKLVSGRPTVATLDSITRVGAARLRHWVPNDYIDPSREMYIRSALHLRGIKTVADFFARRPKLALARLNHEIGKVDDRDVREALHFAFTNTAWHASKMRRYNARGGQRPLTGTLFIPQLISEPNVFEVFRNQVRQLGRFYDQFPSGATEVDVHCGSATNLSWIADQSVDYVFTDPPFGNNIHYADCNIVWEAWLGEVTNNDAEIVVNKSRRLENGGKTVADYQRLLAEAFREARRVVVPNGRVSIVFHNSDDAVWSALLDAVETAGLHQAEVSILDKGQRSQKGYKVRQGELVPFYDLVMTFTPDKSMVPRLNGAGHLALDVVNDHLGRIAAGPAPERGLDYLYSVAVGGVIRSGARPVGLSLRAFETLCETNLHKVGQHYYLAVER